MFTCECLGSYHPWRNGTNDQFDDYSRLLLRLKSGQGVDQFVSLLEKKVDLSRINLVCVVPSHQANVTSGGIGLVAQKLAQKHGLFDGTHCLQRVENIPKLARGGKRDIDVHLMSIEVCDPDIVCGSCILLMDDIRTTGHSLEACAALLLHAGAQEVRAVALAQTE